MRTTLIQIFPCCISSPCLTEKIGKLSGGNTVFISRAYVIGTGFRAVLILHTCNHQICTQRFQYMLIRSGGMRITHGNFSAISHSPDTIRNDTVCRKVTAADYISGARSRYCNTGFFKESFFVTVCNKL